MHRFILFLSSFVVVSMTSRANAASEYDVNSLITFEEFSMMSPAAQDRYVTGLRAIFDDWSNYQNQEKMKYQSVGITPPKAYSSLSIFFGEAEADVDQRPCAYAGYISEMDVNGRHCMSREKCGDTTKRSWVKCNPLVYGAGVCAPPGNGGTAYCAKNAKSNEDIRRYILSHRQEFVDLRYQLEQVCSTVRNTTICQAIKFRVGQMFEQVKDQLPRGTSPNRDAAPASVSGGVQVPPTGRPVGPQREGTNVPPPTAPRPVSSTVVSAPRPAPVSDVLASGNPRPTASSQQRQSDGSAEIVVTGTRPPRDCEPYARVPGSCVASALMQPMTGPQDSSWAGKTLMGLEEAQGLMCAQNALNPEFLESVRRFIRQQTSRVAAMSRRERNYYSCHYKQMSDNFEACVQVAQRNRSSGRIFDGGPIGAQLVQRGNIIDMKLTGTSDVKSTGTVEPYLGLMIGLWNVNLCKVTMTEGSVGSSQPNSTPVQPAQGGSAGQ